MTRRPPIRVVIADDHAVVRDGLWRILDDEPDLEVVGAAATGHEAVAVSLALRPDVVVMDVVLPELNGLDAIGAIRHAAPEIEFVVLSMLASPEHLHRALQAGAVGFVAKSSAGAEVVAAVRSAARGRRHLGRRPVAAGSGRGRRPADGESVPSPLESLSPREREVMALVVAGRSSREIARRLGLAPGTVDTYRSRLMHKLGMPDLPALVRFAVSHGLTPP